MIYSNRTVITIQSVASCHCLVHSVCITLKARHKPPLSEFRIMDVIIVTTHEIDY